MCQNLQPPKVKGKRGESGASGETEQQVRGLGGQLISPNPDVGGYVCLLSLQGTYKFR